VSILLGHGVSLNRLDDKTQDKFLRVRYKFKNESTFISITVTEKQYVNLLEIPVIEQCEILGSVIKPVSQQEKSQFNQKILILCGENSNKSKYLLQ
jgi:hypothetical protein